MTTPSFTLFFIKELAEGVREGGSTISDEQAAEAFSVFEREGHAACAAYLESIGVDISVSKQKFNNADATFWHVGKVMVLAN